MNNALTLLGLIGCEASYGYDLKQRYDTYFGVTKPLAFGQVYSTLARLLRDGFILAMDEEAGGGPDRKRYEITETGRGRVLQWLNTPEQPAVAVQFDLFAKIVLALALGENAHQVLDSQRATHLVRMRELTSLKTEGGLIETVLYDHALFHLEADLRWIDTTEQRLDQLRKDVCA